MLELLKTYYLYDTWAMEQLFQSMKQLNPEQYVAPGCSGHGSIKETLGHLLSVQWGYFSWYDKSMTPQQAIRTKVAPEDLFSLDNALKRWKSINEQTWHFLNTLTEEELQVYRSFTFPTGDTISFPLGKLLLHTANHGTHTRAQIIAAIRRAGHNPGNLELLNYLMTHK